MSKLALSAQKPKASHKIALYLRSATNEPGNSVEDQEKRLRNFTENANKEAHFGEITHVYADRACSGLDRSRLGLALLLEAVHRREFSLLLVVDVTRLSRSATHLCEINESLGNQGCELLTLNLQNKGGEVGNA